MRIREVLEWTEINGKKVPKRTRTTFINEEVPNLSSVPEKNYDIVEKIFPDEHLTTLQMDNRGR